MPPALASIRIESGDARTMAFYLLGLASFVVGRGSVSEVP